MEAYVVVRFHTIEQKAVTCDMTKSYFRPPPNKLYIVPFRDWSSWVRPRCCNAADNVATQKPVKSIFRIRSKHDTTVSRGRGRGEVHRLL